MKKLQATLGIATRANKIVIGETLFKDIEANRVSLVVIATDASNNSKKALENKCKYYSCEYVIILTKQEIAVAISKSLVNSVGIKDKNLAKKFKMNMKEGGFID